MNTIKKYFKLLVFAAILLPLVSCEKDDPVYESPKFLKITPLKQPDTSISTGEMGDWIAIQGSNIETAKSIYFNDVPVDMKDVYYENNILYLQIPVVMPTEINNKVKVVTEGGEFEFDFSVDIPEIKLTGMFNEYTPPGDTLRIYGDFFQLYEVDPSNTVISFNGTENPVINVGTNFITVKVPENVDQNIKLQLINQKFDATAECPGFYADRQNLVTNFDDVPYTGADGAQYVGLWDDPKPVSGKYSLLNVGSGGSGWAYMIGTGFNYSNDMKDHPDKYEIKFELNMIQPIMNTNFYLYNYWNHTPMQITASDLVVQKMGQWQTIRIPLERLIPVDFTGNKDYIGSFNIRIDSPAGEPVKMGWDNFRISLKD
ncbi:hypothetical protein SAMN05444274_1126 [Mariniphaga anaerophila]|uniref:Uncharacterized protein n=1 Tax=Mariniphaga anaerophila TaxID=1484053 RepID=A0A1M5FCV5_9BACT|nr:glycan-binding surface protein [Mariniphaga anaerophila]SHF89364.1 hypothetical protein SAMN05444274_1126 [Mariniphaga anaerophila]